MSIGMKRTQAFLFLSLKFRNQRLLGQSGWYSVSKIPPRTETNELASLPSTGLYLLACLRFDPLASQADPTVMIKSPKFNLAKILGSSSSVTDRFRFLFLGFFGFIFPGLTSLVILKAFAKSIQLLDADKDSKRLFMDTVLSDSTIASQNDL